MKRLLEDINHLKGNVLCIGVTDKKIMKGLKANKSIGLYELTRQQKKSFFNRNKRIKSNNGKSVKIKKFRKIFKKKSIEYLIIDLNSIFDYYKYITSNSIYICNQKIYVYGHSDYVDAKLVAQKFRRYKTVIETFQNNDKYLVVVDCREAKYSWFKEKYYLVIDFFHNIGDYISYFLTS